MLAGSGLTIFRRRTSALQPCIVLTPALVVRTGIASEPVRVHRLAESAFEKTEGSTLRMRFRDGELSIPLDDATRRVTTEIRSRLGNARKGRTPIPTEDAWTRTLSLVEESRVEPALGRLGVALVATLALGAVLTALVWRSAFARVEAEKWDAACRTDHALSYKAYGEWAANARSRVPAPIVAGSSLDEHVTEAASRRDDRAFAEAKDASTPLRAYLAAFPAGHHEAEARARLDDALFAEANAAGGSVLLRGYVTELPSGKHASEARALYDDALFAEATSAGTARLYRGYLDDLPRGAHATAARERLLALFEQQESRYRLAKKDTLADAFAWWRANGGTGWLEVEGDSREFRDALKRVLGAIFKDELVRASDGVAGGVRLYVTDDLRPNGKTYFVDFIGMGIFVDTPQAQTFPGVQLDVRLRLEVPGASARETRFTVELPEKFSVKTVEFFKAHPHEIAAAMNKAIYEELEKRLGLELGP